MERLAVLGVGLIGGSVGLAARERLGARVTGFDPAPAALDAALARGALDQAASSVAEAVAGSEAVIVAAPVSVLPAAVRSALAAAPADCVVSDVGSVKREVVAAAADERFVGGHPLAGAESAGVAHARADLFADATWYLTPSRRTSGILFERLHRMLTGLGAHPTAIDAAAHDRVMAAVSHLPHVLANVLVAQAAGALGGEETIPATGPSFRDATRVAGANPPLWGQIYAANRESLAGEIEGAIAALEQVRDALRDGEDLESWQSAARHERLALLEAGFAGGPVQEIRVSVPNRPGVVAQIALTLGRAGINISDMALAPSPDNSTGVIALWCAREHAGRAASLVGELGFPVSGGEPA